MATPLSGTPSMQEDIYSIINIFLKVFGYVFASGLGFVALMPLSYIITNLVWQANGWQQNAIEPATRRHFANDFIIAWLFWNAPYGIALWICIYNFNRGPWQDAALTTLCSYAVYGSVLAMVMLIKVMVYGTPMLVEKVTVWLSRRGRREVKASTGRTQADVSRPESVELMKGQEV